MKTLYSVGVIDTDEKLQTFKVVDGKQKLDWVCPYYSRWASMLQRCYSGKLHQKYPTYIGCEVSQDWLIFSKFKSWMDVQDWQGKVLDKDLIGTGKLYSEEYCCFISPGLNLFMNTNKARRGELPIGVWFDKNSGKYRAQCGNPLTGKSVKLGHFLTIEAAFQAWANKKHEFSKTFLASEQDSRIKEAIERKFSLENLLTNYLR
jgi:hypothetical protein